MKNKKEEVIYVRIEPEIKYTLQAIATKKKMSLNALTAMILSDYAAAPTLKKIEDKYGQLLRDITALYTNQSEELSDIISDNTLVLEEVIRQLKGRGQVWRG